MSPGNRAIEQMIAFGKAVDNLCRCGEHVAWPESTVCCRDYPNCKPAEQPPEAPELCPVSGCVSQRAVKHDCPLLDRTTTSEVPAPDEVQAGGLGMSVEEAQKRYVIGVERTGPLEVWAAIDGNDKPWMVTADAKVADEWKVAGANMVRYVRSRS